MNDSSVIQRLGSGMRVDMSVRARAVRLRCVVWASVSLAFFVTNGSLAASIDPALMTMPNQGAAPVDSPIPLSAVFDESLLNSPRVANIRAQLGITRAAYVQAFVMPNPSLFLLHDTAQRAKQVGASVPVEPPWKLAFRLMLAKAQLKQTDLQIQQTLWQLRSTIRRAYLDSVMATETNNTLRELQTLSTELLSIARRRFGADDVAQYDVNRAELSALQAEADVAQSEKRLLQAEQRLSVLLGRSYTSKVDVQKLPPFQLRAVQHELLPDVDKPLPPLSDLVSDALRSRIDLKLVRQNLAVNSASVRATAGNIVPNPQLNAGYSYSGNPPEGPATRGYFLALTQELPVLNVQQGELARLRATALQLKQQLRATENVVTEEVVSAYQQLLGARDRVISFRTKILAVSDKVARMARLSYEVGQSDITSVLAAQQANVQTRMNYLDAVKTYQQGLTELEQAIGHPLD